MVTFVVGFLIGAFAGMLLTAILIVSGRDE